MDGVPVVFVNLVQRCSRGFELDLLPEIFKASYTETFFRVTNFSSHGRGRNSSQFRMKNQCMNQCFGGPAPKIASPACGRMAAGAKLFFFIGKRIHLWRALRSIQKSSQNQQNSECTDEERMAGQKCALSTSH